MNQLIDDFINIFGQYNPIISEAPDGTYISSWDWSYIGMIVCVCVMLYACLSIFRCIISAIFRK